MGGLHGIVLSQLSSKDGVDGGGGRWRLTRDKFPIFNHYFRCKNLFRFEWNSPQMLIDIQIGRWCFFQPSSPTIIATTIDQSWPFLKALWQRSSERNTFPFFANFFHRENNCQSARNLAQTQTDIQRIISDFFRDSIPMSWVRSVVQTRPIWRIWRRFNVQVSSNTPDRNFNSIRIQFR